VPHNDYSDPELTFPRLEARVQKVEADHTGSRSGFGKSLVRTALRFSTGSEPDRTRMQSKLFWKQVLNTESWLVRTISLSNSQT